MKIAVTLLLIVMVSAQTPLGQLLKFPLLVEHFIKHQNQEGLSFVDFLDEHYAADHHDEDQPEDNRLPFKSITCYSIASAIVPAIIKTSGATPIPADKKIVFPEIYAKQQYSGNIFHPPRA